MVPKTPTSNFCGTTSTKLTSIRPMIPMIEPQTKDIIHSKRVMNHQQTPNRNPESGGGDCSSPSVSGHLHYTHTHPFKPAGHEQQAHLGLPHHLPELFGGGLPVTHKR